MKDVPNSPRVFLWVYQSNSGDGNPGMAKDLLAKKGWHGVNREVIQPQLEWLRELNEPVGIVVHLPFGHWTKMMAIDAWDWARASRCGYFTRGFKTVWKSLAKKHECIAYVGGLHLPKHLRNRTAYELGRLVRRNLQPLRCFDRLCIDTAGAAYTHPFTTQSGHSQALNNEILSLNIADSMFGKGTTAIEATPRNHLFTVKLRKRDAFITEPLYRDRHGLPNERRATAAEQGFGDPDYITGRIHRFVTSGYFANDMEKTMRAAQRVLREEDSLVISPRALMAAGYDADDLIIG